MGSENRSHTSRRDAIKTSAIAISAISLSGCIGEETESGPDDYPDSDIRMVIPFSSGGGFDTYARAIAEFMPPHLPNDVDIIAENVPGAGGRTGANEVYRADPDGYTLGIFNIPGKISTQLVSDTEYDLNEISWIGRIATEEYVLMVNPDTGYESLEDLQDADEVVFADNDVSSTSFLAGAISSNVMGIENEHVFGYDGSSEGITAVIRGDAEARIVTYDDAEELSQNGELDPIISLTEDSPDWDTNIPTVVDEGYEGAQIGIQRVIGAPPNTDEEIINILEESLRDTAQSDEMQEWAEDSERPVEHLGSEETNEIIQDNIDTFEEYTDLLEEYQ